MGDAAIRKIASLDFWKILSLLERRKRKNNDSEKAAEKMEVLMEFKLLRGAMCKFLKFSSVMVKGIFNNFAYGRGISLNVNYF